MISVSDALRTILREAQPLASETVRFDAACGRVLAQTITATRDIPPFRNSAMDGFAVRAADLAALPATLAIVGEMRAGMPPTGHVGTGQAIAIMTGAPLPDGADTVVRVEDTERTGQVVRVLAAPAPGANIRDAGEDMQTGDQIFAPGWELRPADVGVLASLGATDVSVFRRPRVAILATGDELVAPGEPIAPGQIVNSNESTLAAAVAEAGAIPVCLGIVRDDLEESKRRFAQALDADVILSTGGVSMGTYDFVREILAALGVREHFWKIAQKPGKPLTFGTRGSSLVFGLPGNPVSSLVCFLVYVRPVLRRMMGHSRIHLPVLPASASHEMRASAGLTDFIRCQLSGSLTDLRAASTGSQSSGVLRSMSLGDGLLLSPPEQSKIALGEQVRVLHLSAPCCEEEPF